jgi:Htaa
MTRSKPASKAAEAAAPRRRLGVIAGGMALLLALAVAMVRLPASDAADGVQVTDGQLMWAVNDVASSGSPFGGCNFLSAGTAGDNAGSKLWTVTSPSPGFAAKAGSVTIEKPTTTGDYHQPTWTNKCTAPDGTSRLSQSTAAKSRVVFGNGKGIIDVAAGTASISWSGSFTSVFYGGLIYWSAANPSLSVAGDGTALLTATMSGFAASMNDPSRWDPIPAVTVTLATLHGIAVTSSGFTTSPDYRGVSATSDGDQPQMRSGADWGSFPPSFIDFQRHTGESSYWYSSGSNDAMKVAAPLTVAYTVPDPQADPSSDADTGSAAPSDGGSVSTRPSSISTSTPASNPTASVSKAAVGPTSRPGSNTRNSSVAEAAGPTCALAAGIRGGSLTWGFKKTFRSYIASAGLASTITVSGGARILNQDLAVPDVARSGSYLWPFVSSSAYTSPSSFTVQYGGKVEWKYPAHFLDIWIANPKIVVSGSSGALYADVSLTISEAGKAPRTTLHPASQLATLSLTGTTASESAQGITRTARVAIADASAFSYDGTAFYAPGDALDSATVLLSGCAGTISNTMNAAADPSSVAVDTETAVINEPDLVPDAQFRPTNGALASTGADLAMPAFLATALIAAGACLIVTTFKRRNNTR